MNHIKQSNQWNCGSACLAMVLDYPSCEAVEKAFNRHPDAQIPEVAPYNEGHANLGWSVSEIQLALWAEGFRFVEFLMVHPDLDKLQDDATRLQWWGRAKGNILTMPEDELEGYLDSCNHAVIAAVESAPGKKHWTVLHQRMNYDPLKENPQPFGPHTPVLLTGLSVIVEL